METEEKHGCIPYWKIDKYEVGVCQKCDKKTLICSDNGKPCPYGGVKDFRRLQRGEARALEVKARLGKAASIGKPRKPHGGRGRSRK